MKKIFLILVSLISICQAQVLIDIENPKGLDILSIDARNPKYTFDKNVSRDSLFVVCKFIAQPPNCYFTISNQNITTQMTYFVMNNTTGVLYVPKKQMKYLLQQSNVTLYYEIWNGVLARKYKLGIYLIKK